MQAEGRELKSFRVGWGALLTVTALLAVTAGLLVRVRETRPVAQPVLRMHLPEQAGEWHGTDVLFCQNERCPRAFSACELAPADQCPECGGPLDTMSVAERHVLPSDTIVLKKLYTRGSREQFLVSVVLSGAEQKSIHRPQQCLPAQGYAIEGSRVMSVAMERGPPLKVMLLDLRAQGARRGAGEPLLFAYWFVGPGRQTPYHLARLYWMSADLLFRNVAPRWAYVAVSPFGSGRPASAARQAEILSDFLRALAPAIAP